MRRILSGLIVAFALTATSVATTNAQAYMNNAYPHGSYSVSCVNIQMRGSMLSAYCMAPNGNRRYSALNVATCPRNDVANDDGRLACGRGGGYQPGYGGGGYRPGYGGLPRGSYKVSCVNIQMHGTTLSAACMMPNGQRQYSRLNVARCPRNDVANNNGYLACGGT